MTTIKKIIQRVDRNNVNCYNEETKLAWIAELDGKIAVDVMLMDISELGRFDYRYPGDMEAEPLVKFPFDSLYDHWIKAQICILDEEWERYANAMEVYNAFYSEYVNWFLSTYHPAQGCMNDGSPRPNVPTYYITAYGLDVMKGYQGTLEEWLAHLHGQKGDKGDKGDPGARLRIGTVESVDSSEAAYATIGGTVADPVLNLGIPRQTGEFLQLKGGRMRGNLNMASYKLKGLPVPTAEDEAASKSYADRTGLAYRGTTAQIDPESAELAQGVYKVTTLIYGISDGVLLQWQFIPGELGMQWLISASGDRMWLRICWAGAMQNWRQLGFGYGEALPEDGQEGQLYLLKV